MTISTRSHSSKYKNDLPAVKMPFCTQKCLLLHKNVSQRTKVLHLNTKISVHTHKCLSSLKHVCHSSENPRLSTKMPCARQIFPEKYMLAYKNALLTLTSAFSAMVSLLFYQKILSIKSTHLHSRMTVSTKNNSSKYKNVSPALKMSFGTTKYRSMHQNPF